MPVKNRIQLRRGTTQQWNETIDILQNGEVGFDTDVYNVKIGDGETSWTDLPWLVDVSGQIVSVTGIFDVLEFNTNPGVIPTEGQAAWDSTYGTLSIGLAGDHVLNLGQETHFRIRNETGDTLYKGQAVYATGVHDDNIRIEADKYTANGTIREVRFIGLVSEDVTDNNSGFTTNFGYVRGNTISVLDTRGNGSVNGAQSLYTADEPSWAQGDILYVHPTVPGKLTKIEPKHSISVALVVRVHQEQGVLLVRPTSYGHLSDSHDVDISGATNGQFLQYNSSTDYWIPSSSGNFTTLQVSGTAVPTGVGTINHIAYWNSANSIAADSGQLAWDPTNNRLGIGTSSPLAQLHVFNPIPSASISEVARFGTSGTYDGNFRFLVGSTSDRGGELRYYEGSTEYSRVNFDVNRIDFITRGAYPINFLTNNNGTEGHNQRMTITSSGLIGIGTTTPEYKLQVNGSFGATTKSFRINHPSKKGYSLEYGSLESPYHGVRLTGRDVVIKGVGTVSLPDYLKDLIHDDDTLNIQITNIKHGKTIYIDKIDLKNDQFIVKVDRAKTLGNLEFFWTLSGVRKDVDNLVVEKRN